MSCKLDKSDMVAVEAHEVSYRYPDGTVGVRRASICVRSGERVVILGPNGSGKSTLLMLLDGLLQPESGYVKIFGVRLTKRNARMLRRNIGYVFQDADDMLFCATVREDLEYGPAQLDIPREEALERIKELTELFSLDEVLEKPPFRLSGGEKKRAAIAAVLSLRPRILLVDEPTANMDAESKNTLISFLNFLNAEHKITLITTTQDVEIAPQLATRIYIMGRNKETVAEGSVKEMLTDEKLLEANGLEAPCIVRLFKKLGYKNCPLTIEEAFSALSK